MPYSSGTFSRVHDFTSDRDAGIKIQASRTDAEFDGIATALSTAILKDGTQTTTAVVPFAFGISIVDNKAITLGTNSDITIQYDETTNDSLEIAAAVEGAALGIVLKSDQGDDNADQHKLSIADGGTLTLASKISGSFVTYLTHTPNSTVASSTLAVAGNLTVGGNLTLGSGAELSEAELEMLDGITAGTVAASKAVVVDSNKDIASFRNITLTGELDAGSLDVSGDADIDGTLEADAITVDGTALSEVISDTTGAMFSSNTETGITVTYQDADNTIDVEIDAAQTAITSVVNTSLEIGRDADNRIKFGTDNQIIFEVDGGDNVIFKTSGEIEASSLDISGNIDVDGTANLDAVDIDGDVNIDSKLFNIDSSNDRIGINTNSFAENDAAKMTINADNTGAIIINNTGQTNGEFAPILFTAHASNTAHPKQGIGVKRTGDFGVGDLVFAVDSNADAADVDMTNDAKMTISQAGYVTMPSQPSIAMDANLGGNVTFTSDTVLVDWTAFHQTGITYSSSNGRFTVPVAGKYLITCGVYLYQNNEFQRLHVRKNGSIIVHSTADYQTGDADIGQDISLNVTTIQSLSASDYIDFQMLGGGTDRVHMVSKHSHCAIHLLS